MWSRKSDEGASAVEYGLLVAAVAAVIAAAVFGIGTLVSQEFNRTCANIEAADGTSNTPNC
jgi:pilus assembly protein Flp/PilA